MLRDARASLIHRWLRSSLNRWWAEGCCAGNSPFSTIFEACRRCNSLESAFCLATTVADVLKQVCVLEEWMSKYVSHLLVLANPISDELFDHY